MINFNVQNMPYEQLMALQEQINRRKGQIGKEIQTQHSPEFINHVGLDRIMQIPVVDAATLNLHGKSRFHRGVVTPAMMGNRRVARGLDGSNHSFIAMGVDLLYEKTGEKMTRVVEVVFNEDSLNGDGNTYVTQPYNVGEDKQNYKSGLQSCGEVDNKHYQMVGKLLSGEKVPCPFAGHLVMELAK